MLAFVLDTVLRLTHPFAPFVTETIWQTLSWYHGTLISQSWPSTPSYDEIAAGEFERLQSLVSEIRFVTTELPGNSRYELLYGNDSLIRDNASLIKHLARLSNVTHTDQPSGLRLANSGREAWLAIDQKTLEKHQANLEIRLAETHAYIKNLKTRLANEAYLAKAPQHLVEASKKELTDKEALVLRLQGELTNLK
jgi:valyl-tRNA synthetase